MLEIVVAIFLLMLLLHWIVWIRAAILKRPLSLWMLLMPGLSVLVCGVFSGHALAIFGAAIYLICVFRTLYAVD